MILILNCVCIRVDEDLDNKSKRSQTIQLLELLCSMLSLSSLPLMPSPQSSPIHNGEDEFLSQDTCADSCLHAPCVLTPRHLGLTDQKRLNGDGVRDRLRESSGRSTQS